MTLRPDQIAAVVLAGGEGRRIGGGKPRCMLGGRTLLERAAVQAAAFSDLVGVAVRHASQVDVPAGAVLIGDAEWEGPLGGLAAALAFAGDRGRAAVLTLPCDMPLVPPDLGSRLAAALDENGAALAASGDRLHPVCGLWRVGTIHALSAYAGSDRRSLKGLAAEVGFAAVAWPATPVDPFFNVNTADDLARAATLIG